MIIVQSVLTFFPVVVVVFYSGPNDLNLFQSVDNATSTQLALNDLALKLVLFYNAKVCAKKVIVLEYELYQIPAQSKGTLISIYIRTGRPNQSVGSWNGSC